MGAGSIDKVDLVQTEVAFNRETIGQDLKSWVEAVKQTMHKSDSIGRIRIEAQGVKFYPPCYLTSRSETRSVDLSGIALTSHQIDCENLLKDYRTLFVTADRYNFTFKASLYGTNPMTPPLRERVWVLRK
jgi:hypothetical protein